MESKIGKVLLIGVTGGTGKNAVKGFLEQGITHLRATTRKIDLSRPDLSKISDVGVELVEANLDDEVSLQAALQGISAVYCHGLSADAAKPDPQEIERAHRLARAANEAKIAHLVYNSAGGADREIPAWIFLLLGRWELFALIRWYRTQGYQADVRHLRAEFPTLLTTFSAFLAETDWANKELTYENL